MKWNADVTVTMSISYEDIEAETKEEAKEKAKSMALEDIDYNNCVCDDESAEADVWIDEE